MPLQVGTMMVVVRAQDFASRTLRRVGAELDGLSTAQRMQFMQSQIAFQKQGALGRVAVAQSNQRRLKYIQEARVLRDRVAMLDRLTDAEAVVRGPAGRFRAGISQADMRNYQNAANRVKRLGMSTRDAAFQATGLRTNLSRMNATIQTFGAGLQAAYRNSGKFADAMARNRNELASAYNALDRATKAQIAFNAQVAAMPMQRLANMGHALSGIGRTLQLIGLVGTGVMAAASNSFANFNKQVMLAATQTGPIGAGFKLIEANAKRLTDEITSLMLEFPATADEMAKSAYDIFSSMDVSFGGGIDLLKKFNQLSVATLTDLQTATNAGITVLNNFGGTSKDVNDTLNLMVSTVRFGRMRLEDFNTMLNQVAPAAANAGNSLRDVAGAMALITTRQPSQRQVATGIARLFQVFMNPDFQEGIRRASNGMVDIVKAGGGLKPLPTIVNDIAKAFESVSTKKGAAELFRRLTAVGRGAGRGTQSTIFAQRAWTFLFKNLDDYNKLQGKVTKNTGEFARALKVMSESPGVRWQVMLNQLRVLVLLIGEKAIPVFLRIGDAVSRFVQWFRNLDDSTRSMIARWAAWIAVGTLLTGILLGILGPIVAMVAHFGMIKQAAGVAEARILTFSIALKAIPIVAFTTILAHFVGIGRALKIMILGWIAWKVVGIAAAAAVAAANIGAAASVKLAWRAALASTVAGVAIVALGLAAEYVINHWKEVKKWFEDFWYWLQDRALTAALTVGKAFDFLPGALGQKFTDMRQFAEKELANLHIGKAMQRQLDESSREMDAFLKNQPKKFRAARRSLMKEISTLKPGTMLRAALRDELDSYNEALKRMRDARKRNLEDGGFSKDFWKNLGKDMGDYSDQLNKMFGIQDEGADKMKQWREQMLDWNRQLADATKQATDSVIASLRQMYQTMLSENQQAFGELFQGPWLTSETFDLAKEWGITPRIQDLILDLKQQNVQFTKWRSSLDKLMKRGVPREFINELRKLGPEEGQAILDQILGAKPKQVQALIAQWKKKNNLIKAATKMDFTQEIQQFKRAGVKMGDAIVSGFESVQVAKWFDNWVKATFPEVINQAVNQAVAEWRKANPPPRKPAGATPTNRGGVGTPSGTKTTVSTDHSKTANVTINSYNNRTKEAVDEVTRRAAFAAGVVVKGWF